MSVALYDVAVNKLCDQPYIREGKGHVWKKYASSGVRLFIIFNKGEREI